MVIEERLINTLLIGWNSSEAGSQVNSRVVEQECETHLFHCTLTTLQADSAQ